jgi:hypothetical protein
MNRQDEPLVIPSALLKRVSYHWLFGLYLNDEGEDSYSLAIESLRASPQALAAMQAKQAQIDNYLGVLRLFCWLFNIFNYAYNGYVLAGYNASERAEGMVSPALASEGQSSWERIRYTLDWAGSRLYAILRDDLSQAASPQRRRAAKPSSSEATSFTVQEAMLVHFTTLGHPEITVGQVLTMADFKAMCKVEFLKSHPDKGGTAQDFIKIKKAVAAILELAKGECLSQGEELFDDAYVQSIIRMYDAGVRGPDVETVINRVLDQLFIEQQQTRLTLQALAADFADMGKRIAKVHESYDALEARSVAAIARNDAAIARNDAAIARNDAAIARNDAAIARAETANAAVLEMRQMFAELKAERTAKASSGCGGSAPQSGPSFFAGSAGGSGETGSAPSARPSFA